MSNSKFFGRAKKDIDHVDFCLSDLIEVGEGGVIGWGGVERWGENADHCN